MNGTIKTIVIAVLLVVGVVYLFLQNWRTTLIPALTIPVSLIGTFAFVKLFGFGPFAGVVTLSLATIGFYGKLLAEDIEDIDFAPAEAVRATGAAGTA